jgi:hypothetical protein
LATRFEAYCLAGVEGKLIDFNLSLANTNMFLSLTLGVVNNYVQELIELKKRTAALILEKLSQFFHYDLFVVN